MVFRNFVSLHAPKTLPDRLMAGLQILVLTMLVRIQLGQLKNPLCEAEGVLFYTNFPSSLLERENSYKTKHYCVPKGAIGFSVWPPLRFSGRSPLTQKAERSS